MTFADQLELLEHAARAAELTVLGRVTQGLAWGLQVKGVDGTWNPLEDDGAAFRLAVKVSIQVLNPTGGGGHVGAQRSAFEVWKLVNGDLCTATRRAITAVAAEMGKLMVYIEPVSLKHIHMRKSR